MNEWIEVASALPWIVIPGLESQGWVRPSRLEGQSQGAGEKSTGEREKSFAFTWVTSTWRIKCLKTLSDSPCSWLATVSHSGPPASPRCSACCYVHLPCIRAEHMLVACPGNAMSALSFSLAAVSRQGKIGVGKEGLQQPYQDKKGNGSFPISRAWFCFHVIADQ